MNVDDKLNMILERLDKIQYALSKPIADDEFERETGPGDFADVRAEQREERRRELDKLRQEQRHIARLTEAKNRIVKELRDKGQNREAKKVEASLPSDDLVRKWADKGMDFLKEHIDAERGRIVIFEWRNSSSSGHVFIEPRFDFDFSDFSISIGFEMSF